jgi:hypothetical protein
MTLSKMVKDLGYEGMVCLEGMDDAFIGFSVDGRAVYSIELMINILMKRDAMDVSEAYEFIDKNYLDFMDYSGTSSGPIYIHTYNLQ